MKEVDLNKSVYELTKEYPELIDILAELGFMGVKNPIARATLGRATTIPKGCKRMGIELNEVIKKMKEKGFEVKS